VGEAAPSPLTAEETQIALAAIARWRQDPEASAACPRCGAAGLEIIDRSARPYAEWYALACGACGLEASLHIPMSPPSPGAD
jgi:hypothetical protein